MDRSIVSHTVAVAAGVLLRCWRCDGRADERPKRVASQSLCGADT